MSGRLYSSHEAAVASGASYRQVDYWIRTGRIAPTVNAKGSGSQRGFSLHDVMLLRIAAVMSEQGVRMPGGLASLLADAPDDFAGWWVVVAAHRYSADRRISARDAQISVTAAPEEHLRDAEQEGEALTFIPLAPMAAHVARAVQAAVPA